MKKFVDDNITNTENDIGKVQKSPKMYISYGGEAGALHLAKETINNMIDETVNTKSPGDLIKIVLDVMNNTLYVSDNGRGIPFDKLVMVCTELQAGSKNTRSDGSGGSAGENGYFSPSLGVIL